MSVIESTRTRTLTNENTPLLSNDFERSQRLSESIRLIIFDKNYFYV